MKKKKSNKKHVVIISILLLETILLGLSYIYYRTKIIENINSESINVISEKLEVNKI